MRKFKRNTLIWKNYKMGSYLAMNQNVCMLHQKLIKLFDLFAILLGSLTKIRSITSLRRHIDFVKNGSCTAILKTKVYLWYVVEKEMFCPIEWRKNIYRVSFKILDLGLFPVKPEVILNCFLMENMAFGELPISRIQMSKF